MESKTKKSENADSKPVVVLKGPTDIQRLKLEKLMRNPVFIFYGIWDGTIT